MRVELPQRLLGDGGARRRAGQQQAYSEGVQTWRWPSTKLDRTLITTPCFKVRAHVHVETEIRKGAGKLLRVLVAPCVPFQPDLLLVASWGRRRGRRSCIGIHVGHTMRSHGCPSPAQPHECSGSSRCPEDDTVPWQFAGARHEVARRCCRPLARRQCRRAVDDPAAQCRSSRSNAGGGSSRL